MDSKEEILNKNIPTITFGKLIGTPIDQVLLSMEEYAKEYTKDFIQRISRNPISCYYVKNPGVEKQFFLGQDYIKSLLDSLK